MRCNLIHNPADDGVDTGYMIQVLDDPKNSLQRLAEGYTRSTAFIPSAHFFSSVAKVFG
ncbi:MAG: hypothetical protein H8E21_03525 [Gammaproteobacteria bacterium]|nr:hypothetical protein [Gammaproteobacteria bacterium]MBL6999321.1 hypothetical protein [Gammaproteobacteria bacterium]